MRITMPRGDIMPITFSIKNADGSVTDIDFTEIYFTVKRTFFDKKVVFQKRLSNGSIEKEEQGVYSFTIQPQDTDDLDFRTYVFDIELVLNNEIKQTTVGELAITNEVTDARNEA